jgi:hypothetical protein
MLPTPLFLLYLFYGLCKLRLQAEGGNAASLPEFSSHAPSGDADVAESLGLFDLNNIKSLEREELGGGRWNHVTEPLQP